MINVYETLKSKHYFIDNSFLQSYCRLIERNTKTSRKYGVTHSHHIIPKSWFKLTNVTVDNSRSNLVNLSKREHTLAHYYLCLCTEDPFKFANELALSCLKSKYLKNKADKQLLEHLPLYNYIYEDYMYKLKSNYKLYD